MKKIYAELARIQQELKAPKNLYNSFGKYSYRNAEGILESVKPLLNGLALIINDEPVAIGNRFYIKATVTLTDGEDNVSAVAYAREDEIKKGMDGCQITGACSSYARKYALNALLMIDDAKDSDDDSLSPKNPKNSDERQKAKERVDAQIIPAEKGTVSVASTLPQPTEVEAYLKQKMRELREAREITPAENNALFKAQMGVLVKEGLIPDKNLAEFTQAEAEKMINLMYTKFKPLGVELREDSDDGAA